ncbi:aldolase/citrate lyase family protein (plasmid) [Comamonadaceae bacterium OTU4NAUVB1]|nr:aldolase/citrate lyase family protein [Comamonadaceae bacterium OTU4NAUVB1]
MAAAPAVALAMASSFLFVPGDRPERLARALASGAGGVIVDLEDAVAPARKDAARAQIADGFAALPPAARDRLLVRVNASDTPWHAEDLALVGRLAAGDRLAGVVLPKAERATDLAALARAAGPGVALLPLVESVAGLDALDALAAAPQVLRLVFGHLDFQADAGLACGPDETELVPVRLALALASRRAALAAPVDGVVADWRDAARLAAEAARARRGGFGAKLCIHPDQVAAVQAAFRPGDDELAWARRVAEAVRAAGGGVVNVDGRMVDAPVVRLAERLLARAAAG